MTLDLLRYLVFAVFVFSAVVAFGSWAVTTRRINPFSRTARLLRKVSDPLLVPIERWILSRGGNPQNAPWWLLGIVVAGGIVLITAAQWLEGFLRQMDRAARTGPRGLIRFTVAIAGQLVVLALVVRVIGSWFGVGRFNRWMRPAYILTDWIVRPLQRVIPPVGMIDITPIVAWVLLQFILLPLILRLI